MRKVLDYVTEICDKPAGWRIAAGIRKICRVSKDARPIDAARLLTSLACVATHACDATKRVGTALRLVVGKDGARGTRA